MPIIKKKLVKVIVLEFIQWAALASVILVTAQKLATTFLNNSYWLVIATAIGCVAAATVVIWIPVKLVFQWKKWSHFHENEWLVEVLNMNRKAAILNREKHYSF